MVFILRRCPGGKECHHRNRGCEYCAGILNMTAIQIIDQPWRRHQMETFSALLAIYAGNSPVIGELPAQRPVTRSCFFLCFFGLGLNERLSKQSWGWWIETPSHPLWTMNFSSVRWKYIPLGPQCNVHAIITLRQNDVVTKFWCNDSIIIASRVPGNRSRG